MIRNWQEHGLRMDFSEIGVTCSDIDLIHITKKNRLIIGEIKNAKGNFKDGQKRLLERIVDAHRGGGTILYITHDKDVHRGDDRVNIADCIVEEYYWHGEWITPYRFITVEDAMKRLEEL